MSLTSKPALTIKRGTKFWWHARQYVVTHVGQENAGVKTKGVTRYVHVIVKLSTIRALLEAQRAAEGR